MLHSVAHGLVKESRVFRGTKGKSNAGGIALAWMARVCTLRREPMPSGLTPLALAAMLRASLVVAGRCMAQAADVEAEGSCFFAGTRFLSRQMFRRSVLGGAIHALLPGVRCSRRWLRGELRVSWAGASRRGAV